MVDHSDNEKLKRDVEAMRLVACLPDVYIKSRSKKELIELMGGIDHTVKRLSKDEAINLVLEYKREVIESHKRFKLQDELVELRRQINQVLKAIINPSAIAGYHPDLDRVMVLNRLANSDVADFASQDDPIKEENKEKSVEEIYRDYWEENPEEDDLDHVYDQRQTENLLLSGKVNWEDWQEGMEYKKDTHDGIIRHLDEDVLNKLTQKAHEIDKEREEEGIDSYE